MMQDFSTLVSFLSILKNGRHNLRREFLGMMMGTGRLGQNQMRILRKKPSTIYPLYNRTLGIPEMTGYLYGAVPFLNPAHRFHADTFNIWI
jgi:hypothetical protein